MGKGLGAFIIGGLIGAGIALLYAPRAGEETREIVSEKVHNAWGQAQELGTQAQTNAQQLYQDATAKGQELYENASARVQEAASSVKPVFAEKNDELREKIEAARQRIAAQVAKNAETAHEAVNDPIPVTADPAEGAAEKIQQGAETLTDTITGSVSQAPKPEGSAS